MPDGLDLVARARETRVVVVGRGVAAAVAALECAKVGMTVTLVAGPAEARAAESSLDLDGVPVDLDADGFAPDAPALAALLAELDLTDGVEPVTTAAAWIDGVPLPADAVLGIPANAWDPALRRLIGWRGAWRAYVDRLRPPLTIGRERNLDALVRARMGDRVVDRLVAPVTRGRFGLEPREVDVEVAAPGLNAALTRTGSLAGAVGEREPEMSPRAAIIGGLRRVMGALSERLAQYDVDIRADVRVERVTRAGDDWLVSLTPDDVCDAEGAVAPELSADVLVVATSAASAGELLRDIVDVPPVTRESDVVALRVRMPEPPRTDVYPLAGEVRRVVDLTATRAWLRAAVGPDERIVHVSLVASDDADDTVIDRARDAAAAALGATWAASDVRAATRARRSRGIDALRIGGAAEATAIERAVADSPGLAVTGAWIAGDGLDRVVAHAVSESDRVRHAALWDGRA